MKGVLKKGPKTPQSFSSRASQYLVECGIFNLIMKKRKETIAHLIIPAFKINKKKKIGSPKKNFVGEGNAKLVMSNWKIMIKMISS